jgi:hypothetical protein
MKLAIVQLSDVHIKTPGDLILQRTREIVLAVKNVAPIADTYLLAVTGDVAFSGARDQYELAAHFFLSIKHELEKTTKPVWQFYIPGNHDLDFTEQPDTRDALLQYVRKNPETIDCHGETVKQIVGVQANFFEFEGAMHGTIARPTPERLAYSHTFGASGNRIRVSCFNTAWTSTNPEAPGTLVFPAKLVMKDREPVDIEIAAFHHPSNWLMPDNSRAFRIAVESSADVIMTGHEHETSAFRKQGVDTGTTQHVEGAVLQEHGNGRSAFNIMVIDDASQNYIVHVCSWVDHQFNPRLLGEYPFTRNRLARKAIFQNNPTYSKFLADPGLPILHPRKHDITIDDLFVYPALACKDPQRKFQLLRVIGSQQVLEFIQTSRKVMVLGDETSGKTCLAKRLYRDLQLGSALVPVLINGRDIDGHKERDIRRLLKNAVEEQYDADAIDRFFGLDADQRVIIIDDWHELKYAAKGKAAIIEQIKGYAGKIICLTSRLYALEELADTGPAQKMLDGFEFCDIKEHGKWATGQLIQKWHSLGQEESMDSRDFHYAVACSEDKVAAVIRKGILPTYPIFIIGLLQADASSSSSASQNAGAYGHILEMLITDRLFQDSKSAADIGTMYTYLSRMAYLMLKKDRAFLSAREVAEMHSEYNEVYKMQLSEGQTLSNLTKAKIICKEGGDYRFAYKGIYCYCVARYFFENIIEAESTLRPELDHMVDRPAWEDYTNIVMFYLYLSRDPKTIQRLLANAADVYAECQPANLDADVLFVNHMIKGKTPEKVLLPNTDIAQNRDDYRKLQDAAAEDAALSMPAPDSRVPYGAHLHELTKITIAFQTLRIMGQVLRNFPGVLTAEPKYRLAEASYLLGLRTLRRVLNLAQDHIQELRASFAEIFKDKHPLATDAELADTADQSVIWLTGAAAYGIIKRICRSVGLHDLELTFEEVRTKLGPMSSVKLVDLSIHLEYFRDAPKADIYELEKDLHRNHFSYKILRDLVSEFLYLRNTDNMVSQQMGALLDIESNAPEFQLNKSVGAETRAKLPSGTNS